MGVYGHINPIANVYYCEQIRKPNWANPENY